MCPVPLGYFTLYPSDIVPCTPGYFTPCPSDILPCTPRISKEVAQAIFYIRGYFVLFLVYLCALHCTSHAPGVRDVIATLGRLECRTGVDRTSPRWHAGAVCRHARSGRLREHRHRRRERCLGRRPFRPIIWPFRTASLECIGRRRGRERGKRRLGETCYGCSRRQAGLAYRSGARGGGAEPSPSRARAPGVVARVAGPERRLQPLLLNPKCHDLGWPRSCQRIAAKCRDGQSVIARQWQCGCSRLAGPRAAACRVSRGRPRGRSRGARDSRYQVAGQQRTQQAVGAFWQVARP